MMVRVSDSPLKRLRVARNLSMAKLADQIGVHQTSVMRMERGESKSTELAELIAEHFGRQFITEIELLYPERYPA